MLKFGLTSGKVGQRCGRI